MCLHNSHPENMSGRSPKRARTSKATMSEKVSSSQFDDEEVPIIVGKKPNQKMFKSHRFILAAFSDVFKAMFFGPWAERGKEVELPEDDPHAFEIMIDFMLTGTKRLGTGQDAIDVYKLVDKYQVIRVKRMCVDYLLRDITPEDVIQIYEMAIQFSEHVLRVISFVYICENATKVLKTKSFINSKFSTVLLIVSKDNINVSSEFEVYDAVFRWLKEECRRKEEGGGELKAAETVQPLLSEIRYLTMTAAEFNEGPAKNKLLTDDEKLSILTNIVSPDAVELVEICNRNKMKRFYQSSAQRELSSPCRRCREIGVYDTPITIKQKSKKFSSDSCIYGVSFYLNHADNPNAKFDLKMTIKNVATSVEITRSFRKPLDMYVTMKVDPSESIFVGKGEECEITITVDFSGTKSIQWCVGDCELDEFHVSDRDPHFNEILMYSM